MTTTEDNLPLYTLGRQCWAEDIFVRPLFQILPDVIYEDDDTRLEQTYVDCPNFDAGCWELYRASMQCLDCYVRDGNLMCRGDHLPEPVEDLDPVWDDPELASRCCRR